MRDIAEEITFIICIIAGIGIIISSAIMQSREDEQVRQDHRYEKCLDKGWQWVDNGCIKP